MKCVLLLLSIDFKAFGQSWNHLLVYHIRLFGKIMFGMGPNGKEDWQMIQRGYLQNEVRRIRLVPNLINTRDSILYQTGCMQGDWFYSWLWFLLPIRTSFRFFIFYDFPLKHRNVVLSVKYHVHICQVSEQQSCGDIWQIWMWLRLFISYFYNIRSMTSRGIKIRTFSNLIAIAGLFPTKLRYLPYLGILETLLNNNRYHSHSIIRRLQHITFQVIN